VDDHPLAGSPERPGVNGGLRGASDAAEVLRTGLRVAAVALAIDGRLCGQQSNRVPWIAAAGGSTRGGGREQERKGNAGSQKPTGREAQGVLLCPPPSGEQGYSSHAIRYPSITALTRPRSLDEANSGPELPTGGRRRRSASSRIAHPARPRPS